MNILHIYKDYFPVRGGIENHIKVLAEAHADQGHQVTVLACAPGLRGYVKHINGVRTVFAGRLATLASMPISLSQPLKAIFQDADVVHVHSPYPLGEITSWIFKHRTPLVITHHSDIVRQEYLRKLYSPLQRRVLRHAQKIIATSQRYIDTSETLRDWKDKCCVIPLGVNHYRFIPAKRRAKPQTTICFAGKLRYYKGLDTLLEAMLHVPDVGLLIAGTGPMMEAWKTLAQNLGIADRVEFLGDVGDNELVELYQGSDLFVLPANARSEAFGTVLIEAMACGLPCITTDVGSGTSWVVKDRVTGRVVPPQAPDQLAEAIREVLGNPANYSKMSECARDRVLELFTEEQMIASVMETYQRVISTV